MTDTTRVVVLHVLEALEGGTSRHVTDLVRYAADVRHVVAVPAERVGGTPDRLAVGAMAAAGADVNLVEMRRSPAHPRNLGAIVHLARLVRRVQPDVIHGHSSIGGALARGVPSPKPAVRVYTPNGLAQGAAALAIERALARRTDRIVAVSESEAELLLGLRVARPGQVNTIVNGVDLSALDTSPQSQLRALAGFPEDCLLVGTLGRLLPQKAPERFVACARQVARQRSDVHFLYIGDGPLAESVDALASTPELAGRFVRLPEVQGVAPLLSQLDVFVLLSRFEGAPYSPMEAMGGGTPVVLSDVVGNRDLLTGGLDELLVPGGSPEIAADIVLRLLSSADERHRVGAASRIRVRERFDVRLMGRAHVQLYRELAGRTPFSTSS